MYEVLYCVILYYTAQHAGVYYHRCWLACLCLQLSLRSIVFILEQCEDNVRYQYKVSYCLAHCTYTWTTCDVLMLFVYMCVCIHISAGSTQEFVLLQGLADILFG
jgi:ABC-type Fe3+-siderophore transport system permease subunit